MAKQSRHCRPLFIFVVLLSLFLIGTVIVLSSVTWFFGVPNWSLLSERDVPASPGEVWRGLDTSRDGNATWAKEDWSGLVDNTEDWTYLEGIEPLQGERIPRIIHQTWMNDVLPQKWRDVYQECRRGLPNYTYHLWTDSASRAFIASNYPSFLPTFDSYPYPIQRADAIRYFVLHHFGGIYMDLDVGCKRDLGPLLSGSWDVVLAKTIPVGVSNDIMLSSKRSAFMEMTIHGLIAFNHDYVTNYPTVMFSTGPMFLSAQYSLYTSSHPLTPVNPTLEIRVMPKSLYGKNASPEEAPHAFFSHFYGSSWHADDSDFIIFLGRRGKWLMRLGSFVVTLGVIRLIWMRGRGAVRKSGGGLRRLVVGLSDTAAGIAAPATAGGTYQLLSFLPSSSSSDSSSSPNTSPLATPTFSSPQPLLPFSLDTPFSQNLFSGSSPSAPVPTSAIALAFRRAANIYLVPATFLSSSVPNSASRRTSNANSSTSGIPPSFSSNPNLSSSSGRRTPPTGKRSALYFLPAFFAPVQPSPTLSSVASSTASTPRNSSSYASSARPSFIGTHSSKGSRSRSEAQIHTYRASLTGSMGPLDDEESFVGLLPPSTENEPLGPISGRKTPPPLYESTERAQAPSRVSKGADDEWDEWNQEDEDRTP